MVTKEETILLSICIPTYNRSYFLTKTLQSIVSQKIFRDSHDVEIIVADNCSSDNTAQCVDAFISHYGHKIKYYRNTENIIDLNFEKVLSYGNGLFLKLNNDTLEHQEQTLEYLIQLVEDHKKDKNLLFFSNGYLPFQHSKRCNDLDDFVKFGSYWSTWIASFGIWREDFSELQNFSRFAHLKLIQTDVLFRIITRGRPIVIYNDVLFNSIAPQRKGGYDLITVFLDNYFYLLRNELKQKNLSYPTFVNEKRKILLQFICPWLIEIRKDPEIYYFECKHKFIRIFSHYKNDIFTLIRFFTLYCFLAIKKKLRSSEIIQHLYVKIYS